MIAKVESPLDRLSRPKRKTPKMAQKNHQEDQPPA